MPELYEQNALWVAEDNVEDLAFDVSEDEIQFIIDEDDADIEESLIVEETPGQECLVPGSDLAYDDSPSQQEEKTKDWASDGDHSQFVQYVMDKKNNIPRHSGETLPGCERAKAYLKSLDSEISKAMRTDLKGIIDEQQIDAIRKEVEDMVDRLDKQIKKLKGDKKASLAVRLVSEGHCDKCESKAPMWQDTANDRAVCMHCEAEVIRSQDELEKKAGTPALNVYVSAFERAIVGTMINSTVSAGRNIEETYGKLKDKYNFTPREELAIQQLVADYGYPVYKDRGLIDEAPDPVTGNGVDWQTNYHS